MPNYEYNHEYNMIKTACDSWEHQLVQYQLNHVIWREFFLAILEFSNGKCWIFLLRFVSFVCFTCLRTLEDICEAANVCPPVQKCHHSYLGQVLLHVLYREHCTLSLSLLLILHIQYSCILIVIPIHKLRRGVN